MSATLRSDTFVTTFGKRSDLYYQDQETGINSMTQDGEKQVET